MGALWPDFLTGCLPILAHGLNNRCNLRNLPMSQITQISNAPSMTPKDQGLYDVAQKLEASFLAEMLKSAGLGESRESFGGGAGEDQFSSFLVQEQAMLMVKSGGIGLTESLFETLKERQHD
jgi:Rod binding domain-containing protein